MCHIWLGFDLDYGSRFDGDGDGVGGDDDGGAGLRKGLDLPLCATCGLALTSNQHHRFTSHPLDYTDG